MILSLQGCMAAGKTSAAQYLRSHAPYVNVSLESNRHVIDEVVRRKLDKNVLGDYIEIQRLWLGSEVERWNEASRYPVSVMDFAADEIEFYTINYPKSIGETWDVESALKRELEAVRRCMPARILFLDATEETLRRHKESDASRSREFFDFYLERLLPLKKEWFLGKKNVDVLNVDDLNAEQVGQRVKAWVDWCMMTI